LDRKGVGFVSVRGEGSIIFSRLNEKYIIPTSVSSLWMVPLDSWVIFLNL